MSITNEDLLGVAVEGLGDLVLFIVKSVQEKKIDPREARQLLEDRMTDLANEQMRRELGP